MICHGAGKGVTGADNWTENKNYNALVDTFVNNGYAVFDCNGYNNTPQGHEIWGAKRGIEVYRKAYQYVVDHYNVQKNFSIYGFSMGGCTALNLIFENMPNINCVVISSPVINLQACFEEDVNCSRSINLAFGSPVDNKIFTDEMRNQNPMNRIINIDGKYYCLGKFPPLKIYFGENEIDQNGVNKRYAVILDNAISNSGGTSFYREVEGRGHEICYGEDEQMNREYLIFFNRYSYL